MKKVFIVKADNGNYDPNGLYSIAIYESKEEAEKHAAAANLESTRITNLIIASQLKFSNDINHFDEKYKKHFINQYDTMIPDDDGHFARGFEGTRYYVSQIRMYKSVEDFLSASQNKK